MAATACPPPKPSLRFDLIHARARELGLNKVQLARRIGVDYTTMWRYEHGGMRPTLAVLVRMHDVLGLSIDALTGVDGQPRTRRRRGD